MSKRVLSAGLLLLYLTIAVVAGALPHHHQHGALIPQENCVACVLHINSTTDVPVVAVVFTTTHVEAPHPQPTFNFVEPALYTSADSRAPPHTSA